MLFFGLSLRRILTSVLAIASMVDLIAFRCNPERGSGLVWTFNQVAARLANLQNTSHRVADAICNKPEDCKHVIDESFAYVSSIPQDVWARIAEFLKNATAQPTEKPQDGGAVLQQHRKLKQQIANYSKEQAALNGSATKAKALIKSLRFSSYEENNLCDLKEGIPPAKYNVTVDQIAALTNMPDKLKDLIKTAINFESGNVLALDRLQFKSKDGNMVFGKVVVIRRGKVLDLAYSLHSVEYELKAKQRQPENAENLKRFTESLEEDEDDEDDASFEISIDLREDFLAYFHEQAIRGFNKHCDVLLNTLNEENQEEVRQRMSLTNDAEKETPDKS